MSANTKIEWTDHTFNPWWGCQKVGPGCDHCYAETLDKRTGGQHWGPGAERRRTSVKNWNDPVRWNAKADAFFAEHGRRQRVFCASMADVFDNAIDPQWRADLFKLIEATPNLDWLLLTKRIGNVGNMLPVPFDFDKHYPNVWIGATIVNQEEAERDIPKLLKVPAMVRFLSMEPLLGPVSFEGMWVDHANPAMHENMLEALDWVIIGGESGPGARPMHPDWATSLRDQCEAAGVPFLFKQWGDWREPLDGEEFDTSMGRAAKPPAFIVSETGTVHCFEGVGIVNGKAMIGVGKKAAGRLLDGRTWDGHPS